jgi:hypothetical protein
VLPDHAASEPIDDLATDVDRIREEERRQQDVAEDGHRGKQLPQHQADDRDQHLQGEKRQARHDQKSI